MSKLWTNMTNSVDPLVEQFTAGDDRLLDQALLSHDLIASQSHAKLLRSIGVLNDKELASLLAAFKNISRMIANGETVITAQDEDGPTALERLLVRMSGEAGKKIHTGRSRNDQVLVALHLYARHQLGCIGDSVGKLAAAFLDFASAHEDQPLPGYSHMQPATISTVGYWAASFVESLIDDLELIVFTTELVNKNPLGTAAGYGSPLHIDRLVTTKALGFTRPHWNGLTAQASRVKFAVATVHAYAQIAATLNRFAQDVVWWTSDTTGFLSLPDSFTTGSSMMPGKRNMDVAELLRARSGAVHHKINELFTIGHNLPSGYQRDLQLTKKLLIEASVEIDQLVVIATHLIKHLSVNPEQIAQAISPQLFATDAAYAAVAKGQSFRDAYLDAAGSTKTTLTPKQALKKRTTLGAPGNLHLDWYRSELKRMDPLLIKL